MHTPPPIRKLLVVGASARAAAYSVERAGLQPRAADIFCDLDLRAICSCRRMVSYPYDAARIVQDADADAWMYLGGMENYPDVVDDLAQQLPLLGNSADVLRRVRDPWQVAAVLHKHEVAVAEIMPPGSLPAAGTWIYKPLRSCGGINVSDWDANLLSGTRALDEPAGTRDSCFFQKRIEGQVLGAVFISDTHRSQLIGITEQLVGTPWLGAAGYAYAGSIGAVSIGNECTRQLKEIGQVLAADFSLRGVFGVDAIWDGRTVWPIEINPRYTASVEVLELSLGVSVVLHHVNACRSQLATISLPPAATHSAGKAIVYAQAEVRISRELIELIQAENRDNDTKSFADIPIPGSRIRQGRPILTLLARAASADQVRCELRKRAEQLAGAL